MIYQIYGINFNFFYLQTTPIYFLNKELKKLKMWLNVNRLALNVSKTNFVIFAPVNKPMKSITILINKQASYISKGLCEIS